MVGVKKKFEGPLIKPIEIRTRSVGFLLDSPERRGEVEKHNNLEFMGALGQQLEKLGDLFRHYGIKNEPPDLSSYIFLSLALARDFVPGFRIKNLSFERSRGRQQVWDTMKLSHLLADVRLLQQEKPRSDSEACNVLSKSPRFAERWGAFDKRTLENRLIEARDPDKNILLKLFENTDLKSKLTKEQFLATLIDSFSITAKD